MMLNLNKLGHIGHSVPQEHEASLPFIPRGLCLVYVHKKARMRCDECGGFAAAAWVGIQNFLGARLGGTHSRQIAC